MEKVPANYVLNPGSIPDTPDSPNGDPLRSPGRVSLEGLQTLTGSPGDPIPQGPAALSQPTGQAWLNITKKDPWALPESLHACPHPPTQTHRDEEANTGIVLWRPSLSLQHAIYL